MWEEDGLKLRIAMATATFMIVITAAVGGLTHIINGNVTFLFVPLTLGLLIGSEIGCNTHIRSKHISLVVIDSIFVG